MFIYIQFDKISIEDGNILNNYDIKTVIKIFFLVII
jgi:hypothetical protein